MIVFIWLAVVYVSPDRKAGSSLAASMQFRARWRQKPLECRLHVLELVRIVQDAVLEELPGLVVGPRGLNGVWLGFGSSVLCWFTE